MWQKTLNLVLLGVLFVGAATLTYGSFFDQGFAASAAGVVGLGNGDGEDEDDEDHDDD